MKPTLFSDCNTEHCLSIQHRLINKLDTGKKAVIKHMVRNWLLGYTAPDQRCDSRWFVSTHVPSQYRAFGIASRSITCTEPLLAKVPQFLPSQRSHVAALHLSARLTVAKKNLINVQIYALSRIRLVTVANNASPKCDCAKVYTV